MWNYSAAWFRVARRLSSQQVDGASVVVFRVVFGLLGLAVVVRFFAHGWIGPLYLEPDYHFTYLGFGWVQPWPGWGMQVHFAALGLLSFGIAAGYRPRLCAALFCAGFTYVELLDRTTYLNHYYLMSLVSLLLAILPLRGDTVAAWMVWVLRAQLGVVYTFAGIAKLNPDWLFHALPMRIWLYQHGDLPIIGTAMQEAWMAYAMSWGGVLFDLAIVPTLLWRRTRPFAYATLVAFHLATWVLFPQLGVFPWLMIGLSLIFFDPGWPRRLLRFLPWHRSFSANSDHMRLRPSGAAAVVLALLFAAQLVLPLRHYLYPGNVRWNEEGYRFAWRVMLSEKVGFVRYRVHEVSSGKVWVVPPDEFLTPLQTERMSIQPDMIQQTAGIIADDFAGRGYHSVAVYADAFVAFNGRSNARLIDPGVNLASVRPGLTPKQWVLPYVPSSAIADQRPKLGSPNHRRRRCQRTPL